MQRLDANLAAHPTPPESIQLVAPIKSARKELAEHVESRCTESELRRQAAGLFGGVPRDRDGSRAGGRDRGGGLSGASAR